MSTPLPPPDPAAAPAPARSGQRGPERADPTPPAAERTASSPPHPGSASRPPSLTPSASPAAPRALLLTFALTFSAAATLAHVAAQRTGLPLFAALGSLGTWAAVVATLTLLPSPLARARPALALLGTALVVGLHAWFFYRRPLVAAGATDAQLQLAAVAAAVFAFGLHFLATYAGHVQREQPAPALAVVAPLARLIAAAHAVVVGVMLLRLYGQRSLFAGTATAFTVVTAFLVVEAALHGLARLYQPARLRSAAAPFGRSVFLPAVFGDGGPLRSLAATLERTFGVRLADTWLVRLARLAAAPLALVGLLGLWLSTAATRVPIDSRGVLVERGAFAPAALPPGLHLHAPWPWARVVVVPTDRVQELSLGFERDLAGPVLWAEKHFEGEQNLLVGEGEELLTINVPIHYRVRDAVAFLRRTADARAALENLAYRELLAVTTAHTAFGLMTTDRGDIAARLRAGLQTSADRLGLGLEILWVGLKDVHPPVPVAPAYQDVVSAEEQRLAHVDLARTYAAQAATAARLSAVQLRLAAESAAAERRARAAGEAARFVAPLPVYRAYPETYVTRRRLETVETALAEVRALVLVPPALRPRVHLYQGFDPAAPVTPAPLR